VANQTPTPTLREALELALPFVVAVYREHGRTYLPNSGDALERIQAALAAKEADRQYDYDHGPDGDATTPGFFKRPVAAQEAVPHLDAVSRAMSALETGSTHEQRKAAWNGLRDAFYRVEEAVPQRPISRRAVFLRNEHEQKV
jgi:hypothetical protein